MGNATSASPSSPPYDRTLYITLQKYSQHHNTFTSFYVYTFSVGSHRYHWTLHKRFHEFKVLHKALTKRYPSEMRNKSLPSSSMTSFSSTNSQQSLTKRGTELALYLEGVTLNEILFKDKGMQIFLEIGATSFLPELGRKGKAGYLQRCSGGYTAKFSGSEGLMKSWTSCWVVAHDTHIACYHHYDSLSPDMTLRIDSGFALAHAGRYIIIKTNSRKFTLYAPTTRIALEWVEDLKEFYSVSPRALPTELCPTANPVRFGNHDLEIFTCSSDYFHSVSVALLSARVEIFITAYMLTPELILTRPPLPPSRLDQILRYKVDQGVKLYILLNKQSKFSSKLKHFFLSYGPNVQCLRHSSKTSDGTPLWHNERIVVVDRKIAFIGSGDLENGRYDDRQHLLEDEDGVLYPESDYRQYAPSLLRPVRPLLIPSEKNRKSSLGSTTSMPVIEAEVVTADVAYANVSVDQEVAIDSSSHSIIYPLGSGLSSQQSHESHQVFGDGEDYGSPETEQEAMARLEAESYVQATPFQELDVVRHEQSGGFLGGLLGLFGQLGDMLEDVIGATSRGDSNRRPIRELFPRQPFHDTQIKVTGVAASDISSYFIQRWNFNRLTKGELDLEILSDSTDNPFFSQCGRCGLSNLQENTSTCPGCQLPFGPISKYVVHPEIDPTDPMNLITLKLPDFPSSFSYIVFECHFYQKVGCNLIGDGPTIVENILETQLIFDPGVLLHSQGEYSQCLIDRGLYASIGDIFLAVDGKGVGHLGYNEVIRLINRRFSSIRERADGARLSIIFRRHYIQAVNNTYRSSSLSRQPNFAASMRSFDNPVAPSRMKDQDPWNPVQSKISQYSEPQATPEQAFEENKAPSEPYSYPGSEIQYPTSLATPAPHQTEGIPSVAYPSLPGVAAVAPSMPLQYPVVHPLENISLPSRVERNTPPRDSSLLPIEEPSPTFEIRASPPLATPLERPAVSIVQPSEIVSPTPGIRSAPIYLVPDEVTLDLPEVPSGNPVFLPDAPTHVINIETEASNRGLNASEPQLAEFSDRTIAMSGRDPNFSTLSSDSDTFHDQQSPLPFSHDDQGAYPILPSIPSARMTSMPSVEIHNRASITSPQAQTRISPMYTPETQFPPSNRRYACQEAEAIERRLCYSILVHESPAFESLDTVKCSSSCQIQLLRSGGLWSIGESDRSLHEAYVNAIRTSNHLIYIENQFLIGSTAATEISQNLVFNELLKRLVKAHQNSEQFRVIVVLPLHPIGDYVNHDTPRTLLFSEYLSMSRGGLSLLELFIRECPNVDPFQYIGFFSLRNWGVMNEKVVTQQVYVHDKLMIVDDRVVIIGSANLTDRSLVGEQDSEIAVRIEDSSHQGVTLGGRNWQVGCFPHALRLSLMKQHLGRSNDSPSDDLIDMALHSFNRSDPYHIHWVNLATHNSQIYDSLDGDCSFYRCQFMEHYKNAIKSRVLPSYLDAQICQSVHQIQGQLVSWPHGFLGAENLSGMVSKKYYPPVHLLFNEVAK